VKAVQELDGKNTKLEEDNAKLKAKVEDLENTIAEMKSCLENLCNGMPSDKTGSLAVPSENKLTISPNPANDKIAVAYELNSTQSNNLLRIIDDKGRELTSIKIADNSGRQEISLSNYANGKYQVQIISNGKVAEVQTFIISK
jgi:predicted RNase H-like nuclease (RuvC/YqgF family)